MRPLSGYYPGLQEVLEHCWRNYVEGERFRELSGMWPIVVIPNCDKWRGSIAKER